MIYPLARQQQVTGEGAVPDLHLHPGSQSNLADAAGSCYKDSKRMRRLCKA